MASKVFWTAQAREDLRQIRAFIARDAPFTAAAFVQRLRQSVERLQAFPQSGQVVPELGRQDIREIVCGHYRLIHRVSQRRVDILAVYHGARLLDGTGLY
jgi:toxin ParE1/3/4